MARTIDRHVLRPVQEVWRCGTLGCYGEMKYSGFSTASNPPQYGHKCNQCGRTEMSFESFPRIIYEDIYEKMTEMR